MSGISVRDLTTVNAYDHLFVYLPVYDDELELDWWVHYEIEHGWLLGVRDDGGDVRFWKIRLGELGEEL